MANASIFSQYLRPPKSMSEYGQEMDAAEQNKLTLAANRLAAIKAQRGMADEDAVRGLAQQYGNDENALVRALRGGGYFDKAAGIEKGIAERLKAQTDQQKAQAETQSKRFELAKNRREAYEQARSGLERDPNLSRQKVESVIGEMVQFGMLPQELGGQIVANLPDDPEALRNDIRNGNLSRLTPEQMIKLFTPEFEYKDNGQQLIPVQKNANAPGFVAPTAIQKQATPGEVLTDTRTRSEGAANRGVQIRGQNMTDQRARERLDFDKTDAERKLSDKPLNDTQSKALLFGSRMREADTVLESLAKAGTKASVPGSRAGYGVGATITAFSSAQQQQLDQAKRDFLSAVLRRESGAVISDSEFENGDKQYFPQIGDSKEVIAQKARNRKLATDGILQEVPANRRDSLKPTPQMPTAEDVRKQADAILRGG